MQLQIGKNDSAINWDLRETPCSARQKALSRAIGHLQVTCGIAVNVLTDIAQDREVDANDRIYAARTILEMAVQAVQSGDAVHRVEESE